MRVTQSMLARMGMDQLNAQRARMARTQEMAATGNDLYLTRGSDVTLLFRYQQPTVFNLQMKDTGCLRV